MRYIYILPGLGPSRPARRVGVECCFAQICAEFRRFTHTTQGSAIELQEPRPGSQSEMQAHKSQEALGQGEGTTEPINSGKGV